MSVPSPPSSEMLDDFFEALRPQVEGELRSDDMTRALYATDASMYQVMPLAVFFPASEADVEAAMKAAHRFRVPVLPRGGGSSLAGQTVGQALVIDFSRHMDALLDIDPEAKSARVEPGLVLDDLNRAAGTYDLMVGPDPASSSRATLGGMLANNATGTHSLLYGNVVHHVRRVKGFLMDGTPVVFGPLTDEQWRAAYRSSGREGQIYRELGVLLAEEKEVIARDTSKHWRRNSGYRLEHLLPPDQFEERRPGIRGDVHFRRDDRRNLARLVCGSEGTLMIVTEMELGLVERPEKTALGVVHFETRDEALRTVTTVLETDPSAVELFDGVAIRRCRETPGYAQRLDFIEGRPEAVLITEYFGPTDVVLTKKLDALDDAVGGRSGQGHTVVRRTRPEEIADVWTVRKEGLGLIMGGKSKYKPWGFIEDASVPVEHLADYIEELSRLIDETGTKAVYYAHASSGTLHVRPFVNTEEASELEKMKEIATGSVELVDRYGGAVSSEHGDGRARGWLNPRFLGPELYDICRRVKGIFDPDGLLNPGVIVDPPPMDEDLRMGPDYQPRPITTEMDFSGDGGFARAVELCNGNGACRKLHSGSMCPSYMVTHEEEDSTRGRANALRNALSGALPPGALTSDRMYEVMDLCIQCKGCKTECPSSVDMAKIKTEWLSKYWKEHRVPFRTRLFAGLPQMSRRLAGSFLTRPANWLAGRNFVRWVLDHTLGISKERELPGFASEPFRDWFGKQERPMEGPPVVLFVDTFTGYHTPGAAKAAAELFFDLGLRVEVPDEPVCCGRTLLSKGRVSRAQIQALETVEALYPYADRGASIVGLEPSCVSVLTDDLRSLLPGDPHAEVVANAVLSFEGFFDRLVDVARLDGAGWTDRERKVLLHGHCHEKALTGTSTTERVLSLPPGYTVEALDAGCCGMAGAFGYEKEHVDVSRKMAERKLAPAVRSASEDTIIAATGFSCRSQIKDTTGRTALHPAEILRDALQEISAGAGLWKDRSELSVQEEVLRQEARS